MTAIPTVAELLTRVERIRPLIEANAARAELDRQLPAEVHEALRGEGLFGMLQPRAYGGMELHPAEAMQVWEAVGAVDSAAAWNLVMNGVIAGFAAFLPADGAIELMANGPTTVAGALFPPAAGTRVEGGWRVTGRVPFGSGCHNADWMAMPMIEMDGGAPKAAPGEQPTVYAVFFPREQATILDTWHTLGMRGTGSADITADDILVPDRRVTPVRPLTNPAPGFGGPVFRMWPMTAVLGESIVSVAVATSAINDLVDLAATKTPAYLSTPLKEQTLAQVAAGRALGRVNAARDTLYRAAGEAFDDVSRGNLLTDASRVRLQVAVSFAAEACAEAVRMVYDVAGSSAIRTENRFERYLRDTQVLTQHASKATPRYGSAGRLMFGLPNDWVWLSF